MKKKKMFLAVLSMLSVVMFAGSAMAGAVPDGFAEVPWGSNRAQVQKVMGENGYRQLKVDGSSTLAFDGKFAAIPSVLFFSFIANSLYSGEARFSCDGGTRQMVQSIFDEMFDAIRNKYGLPKEHEVKAISSAQEKAETSTGQSVAFAWARWVLVDTKTSDRYSISVEFGNYWRADGTLHYTIITRYNAESLQERLKMKGL